MKKKYIFGIMLMLMLSMGAINAADNNDSCQVDDLNTTSFNELNKTTYGNSKSDVVECDLDCDYEFVEESDSDFVEGIEIIGNTTINGHNHIIDCKNKAIAFNVSESILYINDLTIMNGNPNAINIQMGMCVLNNVTFINNNGSDSEYKAFISVFESPQLTGLNETYKELNITNCRFYSTTAYYADIVSSLAIVNIKDSIFEGGEISGMRHIQAKDETQLTVDNTTFNNLTGKYATAIYAHTYWLNVRNSRFTNLYANMTAGAIGIKYSNSRFKNQSYVIENCIFDNTNCQNDGGAIFFDAGGMAGEGTENNATMNIINSNFTDCSSSFGGAIVQLGGLLNIADSSFDGNLAFSCGGAVYTSLADVNIVNSNFTNNTALYQGGALFQDDNVMNIDNSLFKDNSVAYNTQDSANAIYSYHACLNITNSYFENGGVGIYGVFCEFSENNNTYIGDSLSTDNEEYEYFSGLSTGTAEFKNNNINVSNLPSRFDLRDWGWVSSVKNQGSTGSCWAHGSISAIESAIRKATGENYTISVNNLYKMELMYSKYGPSYMAEGGNAINGAAYALSWLGVQLESSDIYDELGKLTDIIYDSNISIHVQDVIIIPGHTNQTTQKIKEALLKYGALSVSYSADHFDPIFNEKTYAFYGNSTYEDSEELRLPNHEVSIVGWDDNFSRDNFIIKPEGNGAWIVKNSWGSEWGDDGYFYMSYYEPSLLALTDKELLYGAAGYIFENTIPYHLNYQTDFAGLYLFDENYTYYSNEYESIYNELIGAVGTYFNDIGIEYELKVYVNGELRHTQKGESEFAGFKTIILDKYIPVKVNDKFKVEFRSASVPFAAPTRLPIEEGVSMVSADGKEWIDSSLMYVSVCLKAYTVLDDTKIINNKDISVDYDGDEYFSVKVVTANGRQVGAGETVIFNINGQTKTVKTDDNGIAKIKITEIPKKYTIKTTYNGKTYTNKVTVNQVLSASKVTVKRTAKSLTLKAKLKINGKHVKGKTIIFKLNGKIYKVKTNANGLAQKTLKKNVIKKLKKGKTYTLKVTYLKDTIKTTVKVK